MNKIAKVIRLFVVLGIALFSSIATQAQVEYKTDTVFLVSISGHAADNRFNGTINFAYALRDRPQLNFVSMEKFLCAASEDAKFFNPFPIGLNKIIDGVYKDSTLAAKEKFAREYSMDQNKLTKGLLKINKKLQDHSHVSLAIQKCLLVYYSEDVGLLNTTTHTIELPSACSLNSGIVIMRLIDTIPISNKEKNEWRSKS